ncbi:MAG: hypothetical protein Ta2B_22430 [Termitinemataceae bacterium]|nr:MAG: hypothetical protein Ta2B_22430 [Termitinemataceae bacterium]
MNITANATVNGFRMPFVSTEQQARMKQAQESNNAKSVASVETAVRHFEEALPGKASDSSTAEVLAHLEKISLAFNKKLQFVVNNESNQVIVKVIDRTTDEVVKELPPKELQRLAAKLKEDIGFLFDERV